MLNYKIFLALVFLHFTLLNILDHEVGKGDVFVVSESSWVATETTVPMHFHNDIIPLRKGERCNMDVGSTLTVKTIEESKALVLYSSPSDKYRGTVCPDDVEVLYSVVHLNKYFYRIW